MPLPQPCESLHPCCSTMKRPLHSSPVQHHHVLVHVFQHVQYPRQEELGDVVLQELHELRTAFRSALRLVSDCPSPHPELCGWKPLLFVRYCRAAGGTHIAPAKLNQRVANPVHSMKLSRKHATASRTHGACSGANRDAVPITSPGIIHADDITRPWVVLGVYKMCRTVIQHVAFLAHP